MNPDQLDPAEALALAGRSRAQLAGRRLTPAWYAPVYGLGVGLFVAAPGFPDRFIPLAFFAGLAVTGLAYWAWSATTGLAVSGFRAGRTAPIAVGLVVFLLLVSGGGLLLQRSAGLDWAPLVAGVVAALGAAYGSRRWDQAWLADMRDGA